jgi:hypothetical protein
VTIPVSAQAMILNVHHLCILLHSIPSADRRIKQTALSSSQIIANRSDDFVEMEFARMCIRAPLSRIGDLPAMEARSRCWTALSRSKLFQIGVHAASRFSVQNHNTD